MYRKEEPEVNIEQIIARLKGIFGGSGGSSDGGGSGSTKVPYVIVGIVVLGLIGWFATGFFSVQPDRNSDTHLR